MEDLCTPVAGSSKIAAYSMPLVNPVLYSDVTNNDSDKTFTVPANTIWEPLSLFVDFLSTATVGNRILTFYFIDSSGIIFFTLYPNITQTASLSYLYHLSQSSYIRAPYSIGKFHYFSMPPLFLPAGFAIRVHDSHSIDAAADDMLLYLLVNEIKI